MKLEDCPNAVKFPKMKSDAGFEMDMELDEGHGHFVAARPTVAPELLEQYKAEPGKFGVKIDRDGDKFVLQWTWTGGDIAKLDQQTIDRLVVLADMGLCSWDLELLGYDYNMEDRKRCGWYARRVSRAEHKQ